MVHFTRSMLLNLMHYKTEWHKNTATRENPLFQNTVVCFVKHFDIFSNGPGIYSAKNNFTQIIQNWFKYLETFCWNLICRVNRGKIMLHIVFAVYWRLLHDAYVSLVECWSIVDLSCLMPDQTAVRRTTCRSWHDTCSWDNMGGLHEWKLPMVGFNGC